jgi:hypothetical protein
MTPQHQSQMRTSLSNALAAVLNHITIFFSNPPPRDLPSHLLSPNQATGDQFSAPSSPVDDTPQMLFEDVTEWSFLPRYSSALAASKWGQSILETLAKKVGEFIGWGEDTADAVRIAVGGVRERIIRATLVSWRDGSSLIKLTIVNCRCGTFLCFGGLGY